MKKIKKQAIVMLITLLFAVILVGTASAANDTWVNETVDNSSMYTGEYTSTALDSSNNPHVSYIDSTNQNLMYAHKDSSGWHSEIVVGSPEIWNGVSGPTSIALDSSGRPHISYTRYNGGHQNIEYAYYDGSTWQIETAVPGGAGGCRESSLVLDSSNNPHITYSYILGDGTNVDLTLKYIYKDGSGWHTENAALLYSGPVSDGLSYLTYNSLALDSSNNPHISYYYPFTHYLEYAYKDGSGWNYETVDNSAGNSLISFYDTSIALDSLNNPHISYTDNSGRVKYASESGGVWVIETVESTGVYAGYTSLALDSSGNSHISYYSSGNSLKYAVKSGGIWTIITIDHQSDADVGLFTSLALDSSENPYISYGVREYIGNGSYTYLKYAYLASNPVDPTNPTDPENPDSPDNPINPDNSVDSGSSDNPTNPLNPTNQSGSSNTTQVNAASSTNKTIGMQETGVPLAGLILAVLMLVGGLISPRRK